MRNKLLTLFHFNDVYNIQPGSIEPKGGAAFFNTLLQREKKKYLVDGMFKNEKVN